MSGEASTSRRKRQRVPSSVESVENGGGDAVARSGTLFELDLLDCPICCYALTSPIFQVLFLTSSSSLTLPSLGLFEDFENCCDLGFMYDFDENVAYVLDF